MKNDTHPHPIIITLTGDWLSKYFNKSKCVAYHQYFTDGFCKILKSLSPF